MWEEEKSKEGGERREMSKDGGERVWKEEG